MLHLFLLTCTFFYCFLVFIGRHCIYPCMKESGVGDPQRMLTNVIQNSTSIPTVISDTNTITCIVNKMLFKLVLRLRLNDFSRMFFRIFKLKKQTFSTLPNYNFCLRTF